MIGTILRRAINVAAILSIAIGIGAVADQPSTAQVTIRCWKEACATDPESQETMCVRKEIKCPVEEQEQ